MARMTKDSYRDQGVQDAKEGNGLRDFPPARADGSPSWQKIAYMEGFNAVAEKLDQPWPSLTRYESGGPVTTFAPGTGRPWSDASGTVTGRISSAEPATSAKPSSAAVIGTPRWMNGVGLDLATGPDMTAVVETVDGEIRSIRQIEALDYAKVEERIAASIAQSKDAFKNVETAMKKAGAAMQKFGQVSAWMVAQELVSSYAPQPRKFPGKLNYVMSLCRQKA